MQTFLPLEDFTASAQSLDRQRLGKQRVECLQILNALSNPGYGWQNHPAVTMWRGAELSLAEYGVAICDEWLRRGYKDTCKAKILSFRDRFEASGNSKLRPWWLGDPRLHVSHQSNLIRKDAEVYGKLWPGVAADLEYWWPTNEQGD